MEDATLTNTNFCPPIKEYAHEVDWITSWFGYFFTSFFYFVLLGIKTPMESMLRRSPGRCYYNQAAFWSVMFFWLPLTVLTRIPSFEWGETETVIGFFTASMLILFITRMILLQFEFKIRANISQSVDSKHPGQSVCDLLNKRLRILSQKAPSAWSRILIEPLLVLLLGMLAVPLHPVLLGCFGVVAIAMIFTQIIESILQRQQPYPGATLYTHQKA
jgi:hypothetical protein